jgi:hypothetical protein
MCHGTGKFAHEGDVLPCPYCIEVDERAERAALQDHLRLAAAKEYNVDPAELRVLHMKLERRVSHVAVQCCLRASVTLFMPPNPISPVTPNQGPLHLKIRNWGIPGTSIELRMASGKCPICSKVYLVLDESIDPLDADPFVRERRLMVLEAVFDSILGEDDGTP